MTRLLTILTVFLLLSGCALMGPRPAPEPIGTSREDAVRGAVYFEQGRLDRAERDFKKALYEDASADEREALARDYANLAALAVKQADYNGALDYLARAADLQRAANRKEALGRTLASMAAVADRADKSEEADRLLEEALALVPGAGEARVYVLNVKGSHLIEANRPKEAEAPLREALKVGDGLTDGDARLKAASRHYLGRLELERGNLPEARGHLEQALELDRQSDYPAGVASDLEQLAALEAAEGKTAEALTLWERAFNVYVYLQDARRAGRTLAEMEHANRQAGLSTDLAGLRESLSRVEKAAAREAVGYSLGRMSTTQ